MKEWRLALVRAREEFIEGMTRRGFRLDATAGVLRGSVEVPGHGSRSLEISIPDGFPFQRPRVRWAEPQPTISWHRERDGALCLWPADARHPWLDADALLRRVVEWFVRDATGWSGDEPDLDLERYFDRGDGLVVYKNIERLVGHRIRIQPRGPVIQVLGIAPEGKKNWHGVSGFDGGWAASLGELETPVHDWKTVAHAFGGNADRVAEEIHKGKGHLLLLRYTRRNHTGAIALHATRGGPVKLRAYEAADASARTLELRAGQAAPLLATRSVAVVGIGAVGSFLADLLARSGVARLHLQDGQVLRPGNCVRHLASLNLVGWNKAQAVKEMLISTRGLESRRVTIASASLTTPDDAHELLRRHDLVIDATASGLASSMLGFLSEATGRQLLSVCVQRDGGIVRCDRWPLCEGESHLPPVPPVTPGSTLREAGCGDAVSSTPPAAVIAAAELACRMTSDILSGTGRLPASMVHVLTPQPDPPYERVGILA